jgi:hypothetical protein
LEKGYQALQEFEVRQDQAFNLSIEGGQETNE